MFSIAPYHFEILDEQKQPLDIWSFQPKSNLMDAINQYFKSEVNVPHTRETSQIKKTFVLRNLYAGSAVTLAGQYQTGHYGFESEIYDTGVKKTAHNRTKQQADMLPFMLSMYFPKTAQPAFQKRGLLLLGRFNTLGIRGMVMPRMVSHFANAYPGLEMRVSKIAPTAVVKTLLSQGSVKKIRLIKKTLPSDFAKVLTQADQEKFLDLEYVFRPKKKSYFEDVDWIFKIISKEVGMKDVFEIPNYSPDSIKVEISHGAKSRVIDLGNQGKVSPNIDISDIATNATGHPDATSWLETADELASEIFESWGAGKLNFQTKV